MNPDTTITFYVDLPKEELDNLEKKLQNYIPFGVESKYIIAHEIAKVTGKSHFHVIVENLEWNKFRDSLLIKKYKLKAKNKQFGKVKKIKDINRMISYILKQGKLLKEPEEIHAQRRTNIDLEIIEEYLEKSYISEDEKSHIELCLEKIGPMKLQYQYTDDEIQWYKIKILEYHQENKIDCGFKKIDRIFEKYVNRQYHLPVPVIYMILHQNFKNRI